MSAEKAKFLYSRQKKGPAADAAEPYILILLTEESYRLIFCFPENDQSA